MHFRIKQGLSLKQSCHWLGKNTKFSSPHPFREIEYDKLYELSTQIFRVNMSPLLTLEMKTLPEKN